MMYFWFYMMLVSAAATVLNPERTSAHRFVQILTTAIFAGSAVAMVVAGANLP
jgi:hypothetical protein